MLCTALRVLLVLDDDGVGVERLRVHAARVVLVGEAAHHLGHRGLQAKAAFAAESGAKVLGA